MSYDPHAPIVILCPNPVLERVTTTGAMITFLLSQRRGGLDYILRWRDLKERKL